MKGQLCQVLVKVRFPPLVDGALSLPACSRWARCPSLGAMAQPTLVQRYYLIVITTLRWLGATAAATALVITVVNLPFVRGGGPLLALVGAGVGCAAVGLAFYAAGTVVQRRYRDHVAEQLG